MSKEIPLTQGKVVIVDDADYERLNRHKWCAQKSFTTWYAVRNSPRGNCKRIQIQMHREILKSPTNRETDHRDGNGLNNRRSNLRAATHAQNQRNRRKREGTTSQYKGVYWNKHAAKWEARIQNIYLGLFDSEMEAAKQYDAAARKLFGEFACTNF